VVVLFVHYHLLAFQSLEETKSVYYDYQIIPLDNRRILSSPLPKPSPHLASATPPTMTVRATRTPVLCRMLAVALLADHLSISASALVSESESDNVPRPELNLLNMAQISGSHTNSHTNSGSHTKKKKKHNPKKHHSRSHSKLKSNTRVAVNLARIGADADSNEDADHPRDVLLGADSSEDVDPLASLTAMGTLNFKMSETIQNDNLVLQM
jgi:hypothetical protein